LSDRNEQRFLRTAGLEEKEEQQKEEKKIDILRIPVF
jgi:hypothetical protein